MSEVSYFIVDEFVEFSTGYCDNPGQKALCVVGLNHNLVPL